MKKKQVKAWSIWSTQKKRLLMNIRGFPFMYGTRKAARLDGNQLEAAFDEDFRIVRVTITVD